MALGRTNINLPGIFAGYEQIVNYRMLYDEGEEHSVITGGWSKANRQGGDGEGTVTKNAYNFYLASNSALKDHASVSTNSKILLSGIYNSINAIFKNINGYPTQGSPSRYVGINKTARDFFGSGSVSTENKSKFTSGQTQVTVLDISAYVGEYYVACGLRGWDTYPNTSANLTHVFFTKPDDWRTLCLKSGITVPTDLATLISDTTKLTSIFATKYAVKWMVARCTGDFMASVVANSTAVGLLKASPHYTMVQANEHWAKFLAMVA